MTEELRPLTTEDLPAWGQILDEAFPGIFALTPTGKQQQQDWLKNCLTDPALHYYGLFRDGELLGGMRLHDFRMNVHGTIIPVGGVGSVAVHWLHKKEKVAKTLIEFFLAYYRQQKYSFVLLHSFRPDFYKQMGFGYGPKMYRHSIAPTQLPLGNHKEHLHWYQDVSEQTLLLDCHRRYVQQTHGMIHRSPFEYKKIFDTPELKTVFYKREERIEGYLMFRFEPYSRTVNDLEIREFVYEHGEARAELLNFLRSQADQIRQLIFTTQDESFYWLLNDPRDASKNTFFYPAYHQSSLSAVGLMYRVIDVYKIFEQLTNHNFGGQTCKLKLTIKDDFYPQNSQSIGLYFIAGKSNFIEVDAAEVELTLNIAEFSSLLMGTVNFATLHQYGQASLSDLSYLATVTRLFQPLVGARCITEF